MHRQLRRRQRRRHLDRPRLHLFRHRRTFIGGGGWDVLRAVEVGPGLRISGVGETRSGDLNVTPNAADMTFGGGNEFDAVAAQLLPDLP